MGILEDLAETKKSCPKALHRFNYLTVGLCSLGFLGIELYKLGFSDLYNYIHTGQDNLSKWRFHLF